MTSPNDISTMEQLAAWLVENCYNEYFFLIGGEKNQYAEYSLKKSGNKLYTWSYFERTPTVLNSFETEREAVEFAFAQIKGNLTARSHLVGFIKDEENKKEENELLDELKKRKIEFSTDKIPGDIDDKIIRVFVFSCDIKKVSDLRDKFVPQKFRY